MGGQSVLFFGLLVLDGLQTALGQSYFEECDAQYDNVEPIVNLMNGEKVMKDIVKNATHRWTYSNHNMTTMQKNETDRKLLISLEPCNGIVYLFVRKNIACHPDPHSCIDLSTGKRDWKNCRRTHFMSVIDGSQDGAPTFFQISLSATRYFISVFAAEDASYSLTVLDDVGAWPRRGNGGVVKAGVVDVGKVMLQWHVPTYLPTGFAETKQYHVFALRLLPNDTFITESNPALFLKPDKILNTVCGLKANTDRADDIVAAELCDTTCNTTLEGLLSGERYAFNIVAESTRGFQMAYAGIAFEPSWESETTLVDVDARRVRRLVDDTSAMPRRLLEASAVPMDNTDMQVVGAVMGSVLGMIGMAGMVLLRFTS